MWQLRCPRWLQRAAELRQLVLGIVVFGVLGSARGLDEGSVAAMVTQDSFRRQFGLDAESGLSPAQLADRKSNVVSMVLLGSIGGSLLAMGIVDRVGRIGALRVLLALWIIGVVVQITTFSHSYIQLLMGRLVAGFGIGMTTVVCPTYLVEVAPPRVRGLCTCIFSASVYFGILIGYLSNWLTQLYLSPTNRNQWVVPTALQIAVAGAALVASAGVVESPRWYCEDHQYEKALMALARLRNLGEDSAAVLHEFDMIAASLDASRRALAKEDSLVGSLASSKAPSKRSRVLALALRLKCLFTETPYQIALGIAVQLLGQWTGANAVTMYAPEFFRILGILTHNQQLFMTLMFGVSKLVFALACAFFVIDRLGRKVALYAGISMQFVAMVYITIFLKLQHDHVPSLALQHRLGVAAIIMIHLNGAGWAVGWNSVQYLVGAELFPLHLRGAATGVIMFAHYVNQFGNSKAVPIMLVAMHQWGAMLFCAVIILVGLLFVWFFVPEPAGCKLEEMQRVFAAPWYKIGRQRVPLTIETTTSLPSK